MLMGPDEFKHTLKNEDTAGATSSDTQGRLGLHARAERKPKKKFYQKGKKSTGIKMDINPDFFPEKGVNTAKRPEYPYPQPPP